MARQRANANRSLQHLHTLSWGAQVSKRNSHSACQHLAACLGTRLSRNLPECFPHAPRPASQHLHKFSDTVVPTCSTKESFRTWARSWAEIQTPPKVKTRHLCDVLRHVKRRSPVQQRLPSGRLCKQATGTVPQAPSSHGPSLLDQGFAVTFVKLLIFF